MFNQNSHSPTKYLFIVAALSLAGCVSSHYVADVDAELRDSPKVELVVKDKPAPRALPEQIEAYFPMESIDAT